MARDIDWIEDEIDRIDEETDLLRDRIIEINEAMMDDGRSVDLADEKAILEDEISSLIDDRCDLEHEAARWYEEEDAMADAEYWASVM